MPVVALAPGRGAWIHPQVCLTPRQTRAAASPEVCADCDLSSEPSDTHPHAPLFPGACGSPYRPQFPGACRSPSSPGVRTQ